MYPYVPNYYRRMPLYLRLLLAAAGVVAGLIKASFQPHKTNLPEPPVKSVSAEVGDREEELFRNGVAALKANRPDRAITCFSEALASDPQDPCLFINRGIAYDLKKDYDHAIADYTQAIQLEASNSEAFFNRGFAYANQKDLDRALQDFNEAIRLDGNNADYYVFRGDLYADRNDLDRALADYQEALRVDPNHAEALNGRGLVHEKKKEYEQAVADYSAAIRLDPQGAHAYNNLAWLWATCPREELRNGAMALEYGQYICKLTEWQDPDDLETLAAAYAEGGQFAQAVQWQTKALERPEAFAGGEPAVQRARARLQLYQAGKPFREE